MILPGATLGVLGGGQLGMMFAVAARTMGYRVIVFDPDPGCPGASVADEHIMAAYDEEEALGRLADRCRAVTTEFENIPAASLEFLAAKVAVRPSALAVAIAQDRMREKSFLRDNGFDTARFECVDNAGQLDAALRQVGVPAILKTARLGYDGRGQVAVDDQEGARRGFAALGGGACVLEERVALAREISVVLACDVDGGIRCYPVAENRHQHGILDYSLVPARIDDDLTARAIATATEIAVRLDYCGVLAVEFFVCDGGRLLVNEFAPRPHNSGHWTLDAASISQFEQQVRALCGIPLGATRLHAPATMVNLLGDLWRESTPAWERILRHPDARLHLYGKAEARPGRKMGHYTCLAETPEAALHLALRIKDDLEDA